MNECCDSIQNIKRACGGNAPGLKAQIQILCHDKADLAAFPAAVDHVISVAIPVVDPLTDKWANWKISPINATFVGTPEGDADGTNRQNVLTIFLPKRSAAKSNILSGMNGGEYFVRFIDKNGVPTLLGDADEGAMAQVTEQTNDKNGYQVVFSYNSSKLPYMFTAVPEVMDDIP